MKTLRRLHRWVGLTLALPMLLQGLTGVLMLILPLTAVRPQVDTATTASGAPLSAEALVQVAAHAATPGLQVMTYVPPRRPGDSAQIGLGRAGARRPETLMAVDPRDGRILAVSRSGRLFGLLHDLHTALLIPVFGHTVIGWFGLGLLFLGLSGIVLWWPRLPLRRSGAWRRQFIVSTGARGRSLARQIHYALGGWLMAMIVLMSTTGAMMSFPGVMNAVLHLPQSEPRDQGDRRHHGAPGDAQAPVWQGLDTVAARLSDGLGAQSRILEIGMRRPPAPFSARVVVPGLATGQMLMVSIDRTDGAPVVTRDPRTQHGGEWVMALVHEIHEAKLPVPPFLAAAWKILVGLTGAALVLFSATGALMWALKRRPRAVQAKTMETVEGTS